MPNVRRVERDQLLLMPASLSDRSPSDHLAWFVIDVVAVRANRPLLERPIRGNVPTFLVET